MAQGWEEIAADWLAWARTPDHDDYWALRETFFGLVPPPRGRTLEVGCGEGRVARDLAARGHAVTAVDASPTLIAAAASAYPDGVYSVADAAALPFAAGEFALVVAHHVLTDVDDMPRAVAEAARVLAAGGRLCVAVTHPSAGGTFERGGLRMRFASRAYPLEAYLRAFAAAGLDVEMVREPAGFLYVRVVKPGPTAAG